MKRSKLLLISILLTIVSLYGKAANITPNLKFGNPTTEELSMTTYDADTSAVAVMLCSTTDVSFLNTINNLCLVRKVKRRIKILKDDGKDLSNISITFFNEINKGNNGEFVSGIKAASWNVVNGKTIKTEMNKKYIFEERVDNYHKRCKFTVPMANVGSVIEYAGVSALAFQAGRLLLLDREKVVAFANRHGMAIVGIDSGLPPAPLRP